MTERNEEIERLKKELNRLKSENASLIRANKMHNISRDIDITSEQFDSILSEIDEKEKQTSKTSHMEPTANVYWVGLQNDMAVHKTDKVKQMIINGELNAEKHGMRLICQAAHNGCADIIDTIKMYWKCVTPKMYDTAIITAEKRGNFHIANQLYFAKIGKEAKQHVIKMLEKLKRDKSVNDYLCKSKHIPFLELTLQNVIEALELRNPFSADMLSLAWHYCWYYRKNRSDIVFKHAPTDPDKLDALCMAKENDGTTVFHWAANKGMLFAMKLLWKKVSNVKTKEEMLFGEQKRGRTPFYYTCVGNHMTAANWLLSLCKNDKERAKMVHHKLKNELTIYEHMVQENTFPSVTKQVEDWMKLYPL
eukprot:46732_1